MVGSFEPALNAKQDVIWSGYDHWIFFFTSKHPIMILLTIRVGYKRLGAMEPNLSKAITDCGMITNDVTRLLTPSERVRGRSVFLDGLNPLSETL